ncbi:MULTISPECIES: Ku protein [unclassified Streptomyces]|uniref:non-homologous end joining protein Ku n=1 Tax=unclassified Streptomyces TaxID=2593676 RepID=UPI001369E1E0|nr:Ku protein [Streptomyces sp. SID335]MYZ12163.1 Ku protein [Streptomyces sp. SID337]NDZ87169.1 Ku protein [Streptomyces sp. SID10115]NDZ99457.1 Ku protein [Streptomyces sp. SID10116]NEB50526.1 Ku protein [Streptomyces sp. SID339]
MRSIWNGAISFGLVSIPIKLVNATENHAVSFRQIHTEDGGRIRYRKVCELEEREVPTAEIGKGYEDADGSIIPITDEDLATLPIPTAKTIEIVAFVPADRIDPLQMGAAYYLAASGTPAAKPYTLLREALKRSQKVAIAKFALRGRERLGMLRVVDDVIAMHGLLWPDEIRAPEGVAPDTDVTVREAELDLADALMDTLGEVDINTLHDDYREAVEELVAAKVDGVTPAERAPAGDGGGKVIDLLAALENSVREARTARGEDPEGADSGSGAVAEVTPLARKSSRATPKQVGGKKSTSTAAKKKAAPAAKKASTKSTASRATTAKSAGSARKSGAAKKTAAKKTTAKKTTGTGSGRRRASA